MKVDGYSIRVRYKEFALSGQVIVPGSFPIAERDYLEKIVQILFSLPPLDPAAIRKFSAAACPICGAYSRGRNS